MFTALTAGFLFSLSLIVAIGPQNAFLLRQGTLRQHVVAMVTICSASDILLVAAGVAGAGAVLSGRAWLLTGVQIGGAAILLAYALMAARRAWHPALVSDGGGPAAPSRRSVIAACLAFTWLNPAVYLDTVILLGSVAATSGARWGFGAGAAAASVLWFALLGFGARVLTPLLRRPAAWRTLDGLVAVIMTLTAVRIALLPA
jgi:L-lysine exporter family protein LysE/ArgO